MSRLVIGTVILFLFASCTATKWTVLDENALDTHGDPVSVEEKYALLMEQEPTTENPVVTFSPYKVTESRYNERILVERTVQKYKPQRTFLTLGLTGAAFSLLAANTNLFLPSASVSQQLALNITGGVLGAMAFLNQKPEGEPIFTGEQNMMRRTGYRIISDSVRVVESARASLEIHYDGLELFSEDSLELADGALDVNLASFADDLKNMVDSESALTLRFGYGQTESEFKIPVKNFLIPHIKITEPIAFIRSSPVLSDLNTVAEVGLGSLLELVDRETENWFKVAYGDSEAYLPESAGEMEWISTAESGPAVIIEFAEVPFGQIDVENSVPVLKPNNPADRALIISNAEDNRIGQRQYLDRDHQLFEFYMESSLQMNSDQVSRADIRGPESFPDLISDLNMQEDGSLIVYLSGFARISNNSIYLVHLGDSEEMTEVSLDSIFERLAEKTPESLFIFSDLEFVFGDSENGSGFLRNITGLVLQEVSGRLIREIPNSVVIFSNRPGQSSSLFAGQAEENKRHHIFNYYWAEALKQRKTRMADLIHHLENNIDYTSRRLHDRPQEIQAFGNFTLNIAR